MDTRLLDIIVCPVSKGTLVKRSDELWSRQAGLAYPIREGIPVLLENEGRQLTSDEIETLKNTH